MLDDIILLVIIFFLLSLFWYFFIMMPKYKAIIGQEDSKNDKKKKSVNKFILETAYLTKRFGIKNEKLINKKVLLTCSIINSFIIVIITAFGWFTPIVLILRFLIGFVIAFALIFLIYEIYGKILVKRGYKDGNKKD